MRHLTKLARAALLPCAALAVSACTYSNALLNDDIRSLWTQPGNAVAHPTIVYATDREPDGSKFGFGLHWDAAPHCGTAEVAIPAPFAPGLMPHWPDIANRTDAQCDNQTDMSEYAQALAHQAQLHHCQSALLYVHGYNQTFRSAMLRAAQLAVDTRWGCAAGLFSWSSEGMFDRYVADIERSGYSVPVLIGLLRAVSRTGLSVNIIAHSMGARLTLSALAALGPSCSRAGKPFVAELILAAPDMSSEKDNDDFAHLLNHSAPCVRRVTVYASAGDFVLSASSALHGGIPRAGRDPLGDLVYVSRTPGHVVDVIDATLAPGDRIGHGYFVQSYEMMQDMMWVLAGEPIEKRALETGGHIPTVYCYAAGDKPCDPAAGHFVLRVQAGRQPGFWQQVFRGLMPETSPFQ